MQNLTPENPLVTGFNSNFAAKLDHLIEVRCWFTLSDSIEVLHVDQLVEVGKARVGHPVLWPLHHMWQITQSLVPGLEYWWHSHKTNTNKQLHLNLNIMHRKNFESFLSVHFVMHLYLQL